MKKVFAFSLSALVFVSIFFVAYNISFRSPVEKDSVAVIEDEDFKIKNKNEESEKIFSIGDEKMFFSQIDQKNEKLIYFSEKGELFSISFLGTLKKNSNRSAITTIKEFDWSPERDKAIVLLEDESKKNKYVLYEYENGEIKEYEQTMDYVVWAGSDSRIVYKKYNQTDGTRSLMIAQADGKNERKIADIPWKMISIASVKNKNSIFFWNLPMANEKTQLKKASVIGISGSGVNEAEIIGKETERYGADYLWSNNGNRILISSVSDANGSGMRLGISNEYGEKYKDLNTPTLVSKCVWSKDDSFIFCAVPTAIESGVVMPNDYRTGKIYTKDAFWKINTQTGERSRLVELNEMKEDYDADKLFLSPAEDALFFTNRMNNRLYRINL